MRGGHGRRPLLPLGQLGSERPSKRSAGDRSLRGNAAASLRACLAWRRAILRVRAGRYGRRGGRTLLFVCGALPCRARPPVGRVHVREPKRRRFEITPLGDRADLPQEGASVGSLSALDRSASLCSGSRGAHAPEHGAPCGFPCRRDGQCPDAAATLAISSSPSPAPGLPRPRRTTRAPVSAGGRRPNEPACAAGRCARARRPDPLPLPPTWILWASSAWR
jgi:hypothetical protein